MAETIASLAVRIGADISDFEKNMKEFRRTFGKVGQQIQDVGTQIGTAFTAAGGAIAAGLGFAVKTAADFDAQMSRVGAIAGAAGSDLEALRQTALDLGASTSKSATEVAKGMELMAAMGYNTNQIIAAMPGVIAAAEASGEDMATVAETVAAALNSFGLEASEASRVADVLAQAANDSAAGIKDMQYSFKYAAPVAAQLGISLEELAASTEIMANAGIKGEQAGTTLRAALLRLADPPKEAANKLRELGVAITDQNGNMLPFNQIVAQLSKSLQGMGTAQKVAALSTIFGTEAASGMLTVIEAGPDKLSELTKALQNSAGASQDAASKMKDNLKGAMEELSGAVETASISIGSALAPAVRSIADGISSLVNWFNQLSPQTQQFIAVGAAVTAAIMLMVGAVGFLVAALGALAAAEWAVILPIAGIIAGITVAIAAIVALGVFIYSYWDQIVAYLSGVWDTIVSTAKSACDGLKTFFADLWVGITEGAANAWNGLVAFITGLWNGLKQFASDVWNGIKSAVVGAFEWMYNHNYYFQYLVDFIVNAWNKIKEFTAQAWNSIKDFSTAVWTSIKDTLSGIWESIKLAISERWNAIKDVTMLVWTTISNWLAGLWQRLQTQISGAWNSIYGVISGVWSRIKDGFNSLVQAAWNWGSNLVQEFINGFKSRFSALVDALQEAGGAIADFLGFHSPTKLGPGREADQWAPNFVNMFAEGVEQTLPRLNASLADMALMLQQPTLTQGALEPQLSSGGGGSPIVINIYGPDPEEVVSRLERELVRRGVI